MQVWNERNAEIAAALKLIARCEATRRGLREHGFYQLELSFCDVMRVVDARAELEAIAESLHERVDT